jgi:hypothetical protein
VLTELFALTTTCDPPAEEYVMVTVGVAASVRVNRALKNAVPLVCSCCPQQHGASPRYFVSTRAP